MLLGTLVNETHVLIGSHRHAVVPPSQLKSFSQTAMWIAMCSNRSRSLVLGLALLPGLASACDTTTQLDGMLSIPQCDPGSAIGGCIPGTKAVFDALQALDVPSVYTIGVQTSPWRMYDAEGRILTVEEVAAAVRRDRPPTDLRVQLLGSWTAAMPDGSGHTLARRLSTALGGFPVDGTDGFLWLGATGETRTTRQAFSAWKAGSYSVDAGADVMAALVPGAPAQFEDDFARNGIAEGVVQAGIGHDVFMLCQERALAAFERAAGMGSAIGAYNAGLMHAQAGDRVAATTWLQKAASLGEPKAAAALGAQTAPAALTSDGIIPKDREQSMGQIQ